MGSALYEIDRYFPVDGVYHAFGDGAHIVFVNGANRDEKTDLGRLMHDLDCPDPALMHYKELADAVRHYKFTETGGRKMRGTLAEYVAEHMADYVEDAKQEGREEGREETRLNLLRTMLANGGSPEEIGRLTSIPLAEIQALAAQAAK